MDEALRILLQGIISLVVALIAYLAAVSRAKADVAKRAEEAELSRQEELTNTRNALNKSLEQFQTLFAEERVKFDLKSKEFDALERQHVEQGSKVAALDKRVRELETSLGQYKLTVAEKDRLIDELTSNQSKMNDRLMALEHERDGLATLAKQREDELQQRDVTITELRGKLESTEATVANLQERITELEKKKTGELDATKVPDAPPAETASADGGKLSPETKTD